MRLALAAGLFAEGARSFREPDTSPMPLAVAEILAAAFLSLGLWTPAAALLASLLEIGTLLLLGGPIEIHLLRTAVGLALAALGPGALSVDAHFFGRKRVDITSFRND